MYQSLPQTRRLLTFVVPLVFECWRLRGVPAEGWDFLGWLFGLAAWKWACETLLSHGIGACLQRPVCRLSIRVPSPSAGRQWPCARSAVHPLLLPGRTKRYRRNSLILLWKIAYFVGSPKHNNSNKIVTCFCFCVVLDEAHIHGKHLLYPPWECM